MIKVNVIPAGCCCGWIWWGPVDPDGWWELVRPEPSCPQATHHVRRPLVQPTLDELPEWEIGP